MAENPAARDEAWATASRSQLRVRSFSTPVRRDPRVIELTGSAADGWRTTEGDIDVTTETAVVDIASGSPLAVTDLERGDIGVAKITVVGLRHDRTFGRVATSLAVARPSSRLVEQTCELERRLPEIVSGASALAKRHVVAHALRRERTLAVELDALLVRTFLGRTADDVQDHYGLQVVRSDLLATMDKLGLPCLFCVDAIAGNCAKPEQRSAPFLRTIFELNRGLERTNDPRRFRPVVLGSAQDRDTYLLLTLEQHTQLLASGVVAR